jgi:hypothetical protein
LPVAGRPFAVWKAASALRVLEPPRPSMIPGEKAVQGQGRQEEQDRELRRMFRHGASFSEV